VMILIAALAVLPFLLFRSKALPMPIARSFWMAMLVFAFVNFIVYPTILRYQAGTQAGHWLDTTSASAMTPPFQGAPQPAAIAFQRVTNDTAYLLQEAPVDYSFEFDCKLPVSRIPMDSLPSIIARGRPALVFAPSSFADTLVLRRMTAQTLHRLPNFHISQLTGEFVNYRTRASVLTPWSIFLVGRYPAAP
jgi:hypothetical protein